MKSKLVLVALLIFSTVQVFVPTDGRAEDNAVEGGWSLNRIWEIERSDDPPYSLLNLETGSIPRDLFGVRIDGEDNIYLVDYLTKKLIKINQYGEEVFQVGQVGEGPEDVQTLGEPIFWPGFHVAQTDYSYGCKVVGYDANGKFAGSIDLEKAGMINRMWDQAGVLVAVASSLSRNETGGFDVKVELVTYETDGKIAVRKVVVDKTMSPPDPNNIPNERAFELLPLVSCGSDGRVYVVPDLYQYRIECYDNKLELIWVVDKGIEPTEMTPTDLEWRKSLLPGAMEPAGYYHAIDKLIPRADSTLWVAAGGPRSLRSEKAMRLETWNSDGESSEPVILAGLPGMLGDFTVSDDRLIWKLDDDVDVEDEDTIYIGVYSISQ